MQLSAGVICRALVMLVFLIGLPMIALQGVHWSEALRRVQRNWEGLGLPSFAGSTATVSNQATTEAPSYQPQTAVAATTLPNPLPNAAKQKAAPLAASMVPPNASGAPGAIPVPATSPAADNAIPVGYQAALNSHVPGPLPPANMNENPTAVASQANTADPFAHIQERLRSLGAIYYLLESWGKDQPMYRFCCKLAIDGNANYTRYFEATNANPLQAMRQVLQQAETWRQNGNRCVETSSRDAD